MDNNLEQPSYDDINTPVVVMVGIISAILTLLAFMFVQGLYYHWGSRLSNVPVTVRSGANDPIAQQKSLLTGGEGLIPIEQAMEKVADRFGK